MKLTPLAALARARSWGEKQFRPGGAARMAWHLPFDEEESRRKYEEIYSHYANPAQRELYRQVSAMCMADEPGEGARAQMSSPLWLYVEEDGTPPKWVDPPGLSALHTRATNLTDCVLEGMFRKTGRIIEFRVATDSPEPATFRMRSTKVAVHRDRS